MNPSQTRIALLVSLLSLGWSSAAAASDTPVPGPLATPEPATPFGVASWPENWSFDLAATTRSAHGDTRLTAPDKVARRPASRFKTQSVPASFQDYSPEGERYVCLDVDTGVLGRAATGCRVPLVLSDGALAAATASAFFGSVDRADRGEAPTAHERAASPQRRAALAFPDTDEELSAGLLTSPVAVGRGRPDERTAAAANEDNLQAPAIESSTVRPDLSGFHEECPFSLASATEVAELGHRAATARSAKVSAGGERSAGADTRAEKLAAGPEQRTAKATAAKRADPGTTRAASAKRQAAQAQQLPDPFGNVASEDHGGQARQRSDGVGEAPFEERSALREAVRSATQAIAGLRFVHEEDPFLLADSTTPPVAASDSPLPQLNGAYPFWLPGDVVPRQASGRTSAAAGGTTGADAGRRPVIEATPVEVYGVLADEYAAAAAKEGAGAAVAAESAAEATSEEADSSSRPPSVLDGETIEVYGFLADEYAAAAAEEAVRAAAANSGTESTPGSGATVQPAEPALGGASAAVVGAPKAETAAPEGDEHHSPRRVEVETAALIGRATADLLAAIEQWAAEVVRARSPMPAAAAGRTSNDGAAPEPFASGTVAMAEADLDGVRGGFDVGNGLRISFGIERAVYINGNLVTTTNFNVADLGKVAGGQAAPSAAERPTVDMVLIQNGPGNVVHPGIAQTTAGTVIQNTLHNQNINSVTLVNATVNSVQLFKGMDLQSMLRSAVNAAVQR